MHGLARSDLVLAGDGPAPVFRTEVICQNVPSLDKPVSPLAWSSCADPPKPSGAPSAFTDHEPDNRFAQCVCDSMPGV